MGKTAIPQRAPKASEAPVPRPGMASPSLAYQVALFVLFFFSGISGLVYEIVWLRILGRVLGNTSHATAIVLAAFMAGLAVGSYLIGRFAVGARNQLRLYALLEFGIGLTAVGLTAVLLRLAPFYQSVYAIVQENRSALTFVQSLLMFGLLLVPTSLMGGTLPVLSAHLRGRSQAFATRIGLLYGINTLGAVLGVLLAGFVTIGMWGESATLYGAVSVTLGVAALALALSVWSSAAENAPSVQATETAAKDVQTISPYSRGVRHWVGFTYALSGLVGMSYEIVWTRMFQIQVGTSTYAFSIMLAYFLAGIGAGSLVGGRWFSATSQPLRAFGIAQLVVAVYSVLGLYLVTLFPPVTAEVSLKLNNVIVMPLLVVFPITFVLGALFPLVCRCYVPNEHEVSRSIGRLYALNTFGCILGSLLCGFVFLWLLGTRGTILTLSAVNAALGLLLIGWEPGAIRRTRFAALAAGYVAVLAALAWWGPDPFLSAVRHALQSFGRDPNKATIYYHHEGVSATTTALTTGNRPTDKKLWVNGIGMTILCFETKLMGHLPLLLHPDPKDALVICFGMGSTVRSIWSHKAVHCDVVEIVPEVFNCYGYFHEDGPKILADPRIRHFADDGRNFLLMHSKKYDVITIDPAPPLWSAGTVNLYTKEFFELCKERLTDHGILCLWIPPSEPGEMRMIIKTFSTVFPNCCAWRSATLTPLGVFMMGYRNPNDSTQPKFHQVDDVAPILADLNEFGFVQALTSLDILKALYFGSAAQMAAVVAQEPVITDDRPYTEFPLWRSGLPYGPVPARESKP